MPEAGDQQHGRLGRLFAALVGSDGAPAGGTDASPLAEKGRGGAGLDVEGLSRSLVGAPDPVGVLCGLVAGVRRRTEETAASDSEPPSPFETYLAMRLTEAGIEKDDVALPTFTVVRPHTSGLFYLRVIDDALPWLSKVKLLRVEAALNAVLLVDRAMPDVGAASLEDIVRAEQRVTRSVVSQASRAAARLDGPAHGEWAVRNALSAGIECLRLPYRLTARFRVNVARGTAAIEIDLVPPRAWTSSAYVDGLGIVPATPEMKRRAASDYNLRLAVLLAGFAFMAAPQLGEVWVAGVLDGSSGHACYYSVRLTRSQLEALDLEGGVDPYAVMERAGATIDMRNRELAPVRQGFSLEDERFCPAARWEAPELSERTLPPALAAGLGCSRVSGLGIDEACRRRRAARELSRELGGSTQGNVRALLTVARENDHADVREAAMRCVEKLVDGTLADDALAIEEEFVDGGSLERAVKRGRELMATGDAEGCRLAVAPALAAADDRGPYEDEDGVTWRSFGSYTERALYNRLLAPAHERCKLVPQAYAEAHLLLSAADLAQGQAETTLAHAERARDLAPLSPQASLHLARCLEAAGRAEEAADELCRLLALAHDGETVGMAYLRMSQLQWREGHVLVAQACYQRACRFLPAPALMAGLAVVALVGRVGESSGGGLTEDDVESTLRGAGIPLAPTSELGEALLEATRAAVDSEVFPAARDLMRSLCSLFRDDVSYGVLRSLEGEPDR